ncbi:MAG: hypothetical protein V3T83_17770 [Acidobacteriota bacterium]
MKFEKHVFISYANIDNQPLPTSQQGWISLFHAALEGMLSTRLGRRAEIWRDPKLTGNDIFANEIVDQFPKTAILVSVLTPRYLESEWCIREIAEFCKAAEKSGGLIVGNKSRALKVVKIPIDSEELLPLILKETLGYEFYVYQDETLLELDPAFGEELAQKFNLKVAKLAWDITQTLKKLEEREKPEQADASKPTIYLAECSYDRHEAREIVEGELRLHGYNVLPNKALPREEADYLAEAERLLAQCKLSIHLVGSLYGSVPFGPSQKSVVELQNQQAVQRCKSGDLQRIIWLAQGTQSEQAEQREFIQALLRDAEAQQGADLIRGDLEDLKAAVHAVLKRLAQPELHKTDQDASEAGSRLIYLICDQRDRKSTIPLRKFLKKQDLEVKIPVFVGQAAVLRQANQELLTRCDGLILFYGAADEAWKRTVENDFLRMKSYRGAKPLLASYVYLADPLTDDKEELIELEEPNLIDGLEGFQEEKMQEFLQTIQS